MVAGIRLLAIFFVLFAAVLVVRAFQGHRRDTARFLRAALGSIAIAGGILIFFRMPQYGLLMILAGIGLMRVLFQRRRD